MAPGHVMLCSLTSPSHVPCEVILVKAEKDKSSNYLDVAHEVTAMWEVDSTIIVPIKVKGQIQKAVMRQAGVDAYSPVVVLISSHYNPDHLDTKRKILNVTTTNKKIKEESQSLLSALPAMKEKSYDGGAENSIDPFNTQYTQDWECHGLYSQDKSSNLYNENEEETDIDLQMKNGENEITEAKTVHYMSVGTQSEFLESTDCLKEANTSFGLFVARELSNVPLIKRRQIMWQIIRIFEHSSV